MKFSNLQAGSGRLQETAETLRFRWQAVREVWQDANATRFEEEHLKPLADALQIAFPAIAQMSATMQTMQRELTDQRLRGEDIL
jgi:hypothetical protein